MTDVEAIRALTHPLRLELLDALRFDGPSTASALARRLGQSSGATSYHLRQLARHGFVEDAFPDGGGRQRFWRYRPRRLLLPAASASPDGDRRSSAALLAEVLGREAHALDRYLAAGGDADWEQAAFFFSRAFRLTPGELAGLNAALEALLDDLRPADARDAPPGAAAVRLLAFAFPSPTPTETP